MRNTVMTTCLCHLLLAAGAGAMPLMEVTTPGPGLHVPLNRDLQPRTWGILEVKTGQWVFPDGEAARADSPPTACLQYRLTMADSREVTPMPSTSDWIVQVERMQIAGNSNAAEILLRTRTGSDAAIVLLAGGRLLGTDMAHGGDGEGNWGPGVSVGVPLNEYHTFTFHYRSASKGVDLWVDDKLVATGLKSKCGKYNLSKIEIQAEEDDVVGIRGIVATRNIPEPAMLTLIFVSCLGLKIRRSPADRGAASPRSKPGDGT